MRKTAPLLIEIGTEEIPAGVSSNLGTAFFSKLNILLNANDFAPEKLTWACSPRRLLVYSPSCYVEQPDFNEEVWGPPEKVAFADGKPTRAAEGFAKKTGIALKEFSLADKGDGKGNYLRAVVRRKGAKVINVLADALPEILRKLPSSKQMKWNYGDARDDAFIRPVRWIVARLGDDVIPFSFAGVKAGKESCGHRVHGSIGEIDANDPLGWLEKQSVVADRDKRISIIKEQLAAAAKAEGVEVVTDDGLVEEVADLTEWPHVITGRYDENFLRLPEEVSRIELKHHQRCFASRNKDESTSNVFFAVANIKSKDPAAVAHGNERVVNARLADAMFYFERDPKESLEARVEKLSEVVFQDGLGMVGDQVRRLRGFVLDNAAALGVDANDAQRAAYLCKSDLTTGLVGEFPELQGYMGGIYAKMDGESSEVTDAIIAHYAPTGADDNLPDNAIARAIGIAERADKLLGYFHLGRVPTASADPFALRRAAIGLIRLLNDKSIPSGIIPVDMTLTDVLDESAKQWNQQRVTIAISKETREQVRTFIIERMIGMADSFEVSKGSIDAALNASVEIPIYRIIKVADLLTHFFNSGEGKAVAIANKRIANILKKEGKVDSNINQSLLLEKAEKNLFNALEKLVSFGFPTLPAAQLEELAKLREPVDTFFDEVMVMTEDEAVRNNRLALLSQLRQLFLRLADVSRL